MTIDDQIKAAMRQFVADKGMKVNFKEPRYSWEKEDDVSTYGWADYDAVDHVSTGKYGDGCFWVVPEGTVVKEYTYSMFTGTFADNDEEVGINAIGCHCKCGKYKDVTLRVTSSLGDAIQALLGYDPTKQMEL